jgi:hypothetical protein
MIKTNRIFSIFIFLFGLLVCSFVLIFITTGIDELWNNGKLWIMGIGEAILFLSIGISAIVMSIKKDRKAPIFLFYAIILSFIIIFIGFFKK